MSLNGPVVHHICCAQADPLGQDGNRYLLSPEEVHVTECDWLDPGGTCDAVNLAVQRRCGQEALNRLRHDDATTNDIRLCFYHSGFHMQGRDVWVYLTSR